MPGLGVHLWQKQDQARKFKLQYYRRICHKDECRSANYLGRAHVESRRNLPLISEQVMLKASRLSASRRQTFQYW